MKTVDKEKELNDYIREGLMHGIMIGVHFIMMYKLTKESAYIN